MDSQDASAPCLVSAHDHILGTHRQEPILALCNHETTQTEAEAKIGDNFLAVVDAFESGDRARVGQVLRKGVVPSRGSSPGLLSQHIVEERTGGRATCA